MIVSGPVPTRAVDVAIAIVQRADGRVLVRRRETGKHLAGKWEFPGGKLESRESPAEAALRETREECGFTPVRARTLGSVTHAYEEDALTVTLHVIGCTFPEGARVTDASARWVRVADLAGLDMPAGNARVIPLVEALTHLPE